MENPFHIKPTRMNFQGDKELAASHAGDAKRMLFQLKNIQKTNNFTQELTKRYEDGTVINVHSKVSGMDVVNIFSSRGGYEEEEKIEYREEEFPVPIICLSDDIEDLPFIGGYVAKNFVGRYSEYVEKDDNDKIKYDHGDVKLKELENVGINPTSPFYRGTIYGCLNSTWNPSANNDVEDVPDPCETNYETKPCEGCEGGTYSVGCECTNICPNCDTYVDGFCYMGVKFGCIWENYWFSTALDAATVYGHWGFHECTTEEKGLASRYSLDCSNYWPCPAGNNCASVPNPKGLMYVCKPYNIWGLEDPDAYVEITNTLGIGSYGNGATSRSSNASYHGWQETKINISNLFSITGSWEKNGSGTTTENFVAGTYSYSNNYSCVGNYLDYIDGKYWEDTNDYICLYNDADLTMSSSDGDSLNCHPFDGVFVPGYTFNPDDYKAVNVIKLVTTDKEFELATLPETWEISPYYDGDVAIFDYNGKPFYMYRFYYIPNEYDSEGNAYPSEDWTCEYGCVYKDKINKIRFKGVGEETEWAHSMTDAEYEDNDGNKKDVDLTKDVLNLFGSMYYRRLSLKAGKYTVKIKVD